MDDDGERMDPTAAFELLAHDTRMAAMEVLWEAGEPLRFSEVADRAGVTDTGNFNYHFGKLVGHFVRKAGERYELTRSGRAAMTAVLAGDVTDRPAMDPVELDARCPYCDSTVVLHHDADQLRVVCSSCPGTFRGERRTLSEGRDPQGPPNPSGTITTFHLPPAGVRDRDRDPESLLSVALGQLGARERAVHAGRCAVCSGQVDRTPTVCPDHGEGVCETCGSRFAGLVTTSCRACRNTTASVLPMVAVVDPRVVTFFADHGVDVLDPAWSFVEAFLDLEERVHSTDPIDYEARWTMDGETLSVRIDDAASVVAVSRE